MTLRNSRECYSLGDGPGEETGPQVGSEDYARRARVYCAEWIKMIQRVLKPTLTLSVKSNTHDFGTYYDVVVWYNHSVEEELREMQRIDNELPGEWDEEGRASLEHALEVRGLPA